MAVREVKPLDPQQWENVLKKMERGATKEQVEYYKSAKSRRSEFKIEFRNLD